MPRPLTKTETFSTQQADGTIVTTTTKTETMPPMLETDYYYDEDYTVTTFNMQYCCRPWSWLRILQVVRYGFLGPLP